MEITRETLAAKIASDLAESRKSLASLSNVLLGQGHIVVTESGFPLSFTIVDRTVPQQKPRIVSASVAPRFDRVDATAIAATITDGAGRKARTMHVNDALREEIASLESLLAGLQNGGL